MTSKQATDMEADRKRPNVLIFMTDQEQVLVTEPGHPCRLPNLRRLAEEGLTFSHMYPPMAHCCPARATFMTGLYPSQHGVYNNVSNERAIGRSLKPGVETFSEKLAAAGYGMYFTGKWHASGTENPRDRGWQELLVKAGTDAYMGVRREEWPKRIPQIRAEAARERRRGELVRPGWGNVRLYGTSPKSYAELEDYKVVRSGIEQLERLSGSDRPWCLYIGTTGPHDPFVIPEPYAGMYDPEYVPLPANYHDDLRDKPGLYRRMRRVFDQLTEAEVRESIAHYWGYCTMMDDMFGEVLEALERGGMADNTLVLFISDHGEHAGAHGLYAKGLSHFEEGYRVPCVMRWPGGIADPGRTVDAFVSLADIAPTLIEAAGAQPLARCAGRSLVPFVDGKSPPDWRTSMFTQCDAVEVYHTSRMVRNDRYKFVYHPTDVDELYDLRIDPHELVNVADDPDYEPVKRSMYALMWEHAFRCEDTIFNQYLTVATAAYGPLAAYIEQPGGAGGE